MTHRERNPYRVDVMKDHWGALTAAVLGIGAAISMYAVGEHELAGIIGFASLLQLEPLVAGS